MMLHKKSFQNFGIKSTNSMKSFHPFLSLRVQTTGNELNELNEKLQGLIKNLDEIYIKIEEENMQQETLFHMKQTIRE